MSDLISREEALACFEALKNYSGLTIREQLRKLMPVEQTEWISVKKKGNPTRSDEYWVTVRHTTFESVERDYYSTTFGHWESGNEIIAWREIEPSPYKGNEDERERVQNNM